MSNRIRPATAGTLALAAASLLSFFATGCQDSKFVIQPYLLDPGQTEITIQWQVGRPIEAAVVVEGIGQAQPALAANASQSPPAVADAARRFPTTCLEFAYYPRGTHKDPTAGPKRIYYLGRARLTGLAAGAAYRYTVELPGESAGGTFHTLPAEADRAAPFTFVAYGDSRSAPARHRAVAMAINATQPEPAFILHTGDLTGNGAFTSYPAELFGPLGDVINHVPMFTAMGNHEEGRAYRELFPMPDGGRGYYSFDYANLHVVALNSNISSQSAPKMLAWLKADLAASNAQWKVVAYHHPSYDLARRHTTWGRVDFTPVFRKYGVDVVLYGHSHSYQRFFPMFTRGQNDYHPITYIVTAGGGAPMAPLESSNYLAMANSKLHFVQFSIDGPKLTGRAIGTDGKVFDTFSIDKSSGRPDAKYLASALPEEDFDKLRYLLVGQLRRIYLPELPQPGRPVTFTFPIAGCPAGGDALTMKLFLADQDSPYVLTAGRITCPAGQTVRATVTLAAKKTIAAKGEFVEPAIALECHYQCGRQTGVIVGGRLRVGQPSEIEEPPAATRPDVTGPGGGE